MNQNELKQRTKDFALRVITLSGALPNNTVGRVINYQLVKCGTSVAANYRAACRGRSKAEFHSKLEIVLEEADESAFWLELIIESGVLPAVKIDSLLKEANELTAIFATSCKTARNNKAN